MNLPIYQIDAFTSDVFKGNPAAVIPLTSWIDENIMQAIAMENNLSETVFFKKEKDYYSIRWFTPETEIRLCGHATLATAHYLFKHENLASKTIKFHSHLSGDLSVEKNEKGYTLNFPSQKPIDFSKPEYLESALGCEINYCLKNGMFILCEVTNEKTLLDLTPDFSLINTKNPELGIIVTSKSSQENVDFVSRFFHPGIGINEDPVTGSAHTVLIPYWAEKLNKKEMIAKQLSKRGGELHCVLLEDKVLISGNAVTYLKGEIYV
ncbi:PhzF family phenazine biosynthesis protein [Flammeovirga kamogawensis]|uniref:PhzF family phenazine biosynthesis protein n=1 Tax=Flammeovirga kamogawensis TaxID=373891 RepID=A0ABX8GZF9_9BACT|nr:PhzF family phenazine biosynthesis protein [Flammeovirga kamogawensis]MBB6459442.1 PhzF family phenazine biosynthesis protein [Flammeovirga kamogawensis]QWG08995.1 PhzF family phenazine biosynthesis protein [Flammeovirga kamogawensis]TRX67286.1 PhzF family phenazine biosynthesis protein [Flammeovirga kamogawensis]